jgi:hypothetical protein
MHFEASAVVGDAEAVRDVFNESAFGWGFRVGQLTPPLDGNHLPSGRRPLLDNIGTERTGNNVANPLEIRHQRPPEILQVP